jgi:hypothetical protein
MALTKHAVILSGDRSSLSMAHPVSGAVTERTTRAMTFDSAYQPQGNQAIFDPTISPSIPPFNPQRARRSGPIEQPSPVSFYHAPDSTQRSFRLSKNRNSKNPVFNNSSSSLSSGSVEDERAHEMDDLSKSQDSVASPTPLVPRLTSPDPNIRMQEQARKLEWEVSVRAQMDNELQMHRMSLWEMMKLKHTWLSLGFTERTSRLTCVQQLTILLCMVCCSFVNS